MSWLLIRELSGRMPGTRASLAGVIRGQPRALPTTSLDVS